MSLRVQLPHQHKDKLIIDATAIEGTIELLGFGDMFLLAFDIPSWYISEGLMRTWIARYHGAEVTIARAIRLRDGDNHIGLKHACQAKLWFHSGDNLWYVTVAILITKTDAQEINETLELF